MEGSAQGASAPEGEPATGSATAPEGVVGRDDELRRLARIVDCLPTNGAALLVCGEPGVGKSTLLNWAASAAADRCAVRRVRGVESEATLPFAAAAELLLPLRRYFAELPGAQRASLETALALGPNTLSASENPYPVCVAALNAVSLAGQERPLVILVDDLQWVDQDSARILLFVARRLAEEPVALLAAARGAIAGSEDLPRLEIEGLSESAGRELLAAHGLPVIPTVLTVLMAFSRGNPLILLEFASGLSAAQREGHRPLPAAPAVGGRSERGWEARFRGLPAATRSALVVVAAAREASLDVLERALLGTGLSLHDLIPAEEANLLKLVGHEYEFAHPILRGITLDGASAPARRDAYRALADNTSGAIRAWYLATAATAPDKVAAGALIAAALEARRRGSHLESARAWHRAAELTAAVDERAARLLEAANDALTGGSCDVAAACCAETAELRVGPALQADLALVHGRALTWLGQARRAYQLLTSAADKIQPTDPQRACLLAGEATLPAQMLGDLAGGVRTASRCAELAAAPQVQDPGSDVYLSSALSYSYRIDEARAALDRAVQSLPQGSAASKVALAEVCVTNERFDQAQGLLQSILDEAGRSSPPAAVMFAFGVRSELGWWQGDWNAAYADALHAMEQARALRQRANYALNLLMLARLDAARGDRTRSSARVNEFIGGADLVDLVALRSFANAIQGLGCLAHGSCDEAVIHIDQTFKLAGERGLGNPNVSPFAGDLIEAHVKAGNPAAATEVLSWLEECVTATGLAWPASVLARGRALVAKDPEEAESHYQMALVVHERLRMPYEQARTLLCQGTTRRRARRKAPARAPLLVAHQLFATLGASPWAGRCQAELAASGHQPADRPKPGRLDTLTPQELQVARMVASGLNNAEVGTALFISGKTVEAHLTRIYRKLEIRSRARLASLVAASGLADREA